METVKNKRTLREIAKRYAKGVLAEGDVYLSFFETGLSHEEIEVIQEEINRICKNITDLDHSVNTHTLIEEYYD